MTKIMSIEEIINLLFEQAHMRAPGNDEAGILYDIAKELGELLKELEQGRE